MFFGNPAWMFSLATAAPGAGVPDISVSVGSYSSVEASSLICRDPNHSDNASISSVLLELVLSSRQIVLSRFVRWSVLLHLSCKVSSSTLYQI